MDWSKLIEIFLEKNSQINLSAIRDEKGVQIKHIDDSIELNKILKLEKGSTVCDIGTGGGFPLLPLAMTNPDVKFVGVDSVGKKVKAVNEMIEELGISNAKAVWTRIEDFDLRRNESLKLFESFHDVEVIPPTLDASSSNEVQKLKTSKAKPCKGQSFDYVTARAVGYVDKVIDWAYHLLKIGGYFVFYKQFSEEEKKELEKICKIKKLKIVKNYFYKLFPTDIKRVIYIIRKG